MHCVFSSPHFDDHEQVVFLRDAASGLRAILAMHSTAPFGTSGGGCRMWPYADEAAALDDALRLSRAMSYKLALFDVPAGGAKCVIIGDPRADKTEALLRALGRFVDRFGGRYIVSEDVGMTDRDMRVIAEETRFVVGKYTDTGPATAYGTFVGLKAAVRRSLGRDLDGLRVAVQGLGGVGRRLCAHLVEDGALVIAADLDAETAQRAADETGVSLASPEAILSAEVDVVAPCALGGVFDAASIRHLRCKLVAGAANNQLAEDKDADRLAARGICFVPDFVLNAGGVIGASQEGRALGDPGATGDVYVERVAFREAEAIGDIVEAVFDAAASAGSTLHAAAVRMAKAKLAARGAA